LFPAFRTVPALVTAGTVSAAGTYGWGGAGSAAEITVADLGFVLADITVADVDGVLSLTGFDPPVMPAGQRLTIGSIVAGGMLLERGDAAFGLGPDGQLAVSALGFDWAGGRL